MRTCLESLVFAELPLRAHSLQDLIPYWPSVQDPMCYEFSHRAFVKYCAVVRGWDVL